MAVSTIPPPTAAAPRPLSESVDLYAEGNTFSEADWAGPGVTALFGKDGFTFKDALDIVNPLHHLPVVGTAYRALTGDELAPGPRILGGTLYGGIAGFVSSLANAVLEDGSGKDMGDTVLALFTDGAAPPANLASLPPPSPRTPAAAAAATASTATALQSAAIPANAAAIPSRSSTSADPANLLAAMKGNAGNGDENDPTAALIRARAAVPLSRRAATGIPHGTLPAVHAGPAAVKLPGGKTLPIHFAGKDTGTPDPQPVHTATAETVAVADSKPAAAPVAADSPSADIALKMRTALDKYEALMKSRTAPSVSGEI